MVQEAIIGKPSLRTYRDFSPEERHLFKRKSGRLFSSLERERLIFSIIEGEHEVVEMKVSSTGLILFCNRHLVSGGRAIRVSMCQLAATEVRWTQARM